MESGCSSSETNNNILSLILSSLNNYLNEVFDDELSSDEDDEYSYRTAALLESPRETPLRVQDYFAHIIPNITDEQFRQNFRLTRSSFNVLLSRIGGLLISRSSNQSGRATIDPEKQILAVLWLLATPDSYRSIGERFNMGKSSLWSCFVRVVNALNKLAPEIIKFPSTSDAVSSTIKFRHLAGIDGVIGAIDGKYIPIKAPSQNPEVYINRKGFYAVTLQCICDSELKFLDAFAGYPSSTSDIRVFRNSPFHREMIHNRQRFFSDQRFIIGDKAYPVYDWCIPPYIDRGNLSDAQKNFNVQHARTRQVIERAFSLLVGRFRRLKYLDMNRTDLIAPTIIACCVLHNICIANADINDNFFIEGSEFLDNQNDAPTSYVSENTLTSLERRGMTRRDILANR